MPRVSVIIPCFNHAAYLRESVDSALAQDYADKEIIVVNNRSTDATESVARSYGSAVRYVESDARTAAGARNCGIKHASGDLIALLDADDRWLPEKLAHQVEQLETHADVGLIFSAYRRFGAQSNSAEVIDQSRPSLHELLRFNPIGTLTAVFRRSVFEQVGGFDDSLSPSEDWDLWLRMSIVTSLLGTSRVVAEYRRHDGTLSRDGRAVMDCCLKLLAKNRRHHGKCEACDVGYRAGVREAHAAYAASLCAKSNSEFRAGRVWRATQLRTAGLWHNPRSPIDRMRRKPRVS